jgi:hypothetical protein
MSIEKGIFSGGENRKNEQDEQKESLDVRKQKTRQRIFSLLKKNGAEEDGWTTNNPRNLTELISGTVEYPTAGVGIFGEVDEIHNKIIQTEGFSNEDSEGSWIKLSDEQINTIIEVIAESSANIREE